MTVDTRTGVLHRGIDWLFRDRSSGRVTIVQRPNLPLILFVACRLAALAMSGRVADVLGWAGTAALAWWAVDELVRGVNPFRRILGAVVLGFVAVGAIAGLT